MIWLLRVFFAVVLVTMLLVTTWASRIEAIWRVPSEVVHDPWFIATLFDAYFGFFTFFVWVAYKERTALARGLWLVALLALGNIAIASYMLRQLFRISPGTPLRELLLQKETA